MGKQKRKENMYVGHQVNTREQKPVRTNDTKVECCKCDYWCEYIYDADWRRKFSQTPKQAFWWQAKGHTGMVACGECGAIYCETHSNSRDSMICPKCNSDVARYAIYQVLDDILNPRKPKWKFWS